MQAAGDHAMAKRLNDAADQAEAKGKGASPALSGLGGPAPSVRATSLSVGAKEFVPNFNAKPFAPARATGVRRVPSFLDSPKPQASIIIP